MHTDVTLELLSQVTISFGNRIHAFQQKTCAVFSTHKLEREWAAWVWCQDRIKKAATENNSNVQKGKKAITKTNAQKGMKAMTKTNSQPRESSSGRQPKQFNLNTYKYHALGDYCNTIQWFGTTDSYSTQTVGLFWHYTCAVYYITTFRVNVNIEPQKGGTCILVASQYCSSCQRSKNDSIVST